MAVMAMVAAFLIMTHALNFHVVYCADRLLQTLMYVAVKCELRCENIADYMVGWHSWTQPKPGMLIGSLIASAVALATHQCA